MEDRQIDEALAHLYLRLNGYFFSLGFIAHQAIGNKSELDVLAIRFPQHHEPERRVTSCSRLAVPCDRLDFLVGEVKSGRRRVKFNDSVDKQTIGAILRRFGAFDENEIDRVSHQAADLLKKRELPVLPVELASGMGTQEARLRFVVFATGLNRPTDRDQYILGEDLMRFAWQCLRADRERPQCGADYQPKLWGPYFTPLVDYFRGRADCGTVEDLRRCVSRRLADAHRIMAPRAFA